MEIGPIRNQNLIFWPLASYHSPPILGGVLFCSQRCRINSFVLTSFAMGLRWASGGHENPMKPREFGGMYFNLKGWSKQDLQN